jgi:hypothetical protein
MSSDTLQGRGGRNQPVEQLVEQSLLPLEVEPGRVRG